MGAFWDAWDKQDQLRNQAAQSQIQQATGLAGLMGQVQAQAQAQKVNALLNDPTIPLDQKRQGLVGLMRDPMQAAQVLHQIETERTARDKLLPKNADFTSPVGKLLLDKKIALARGDTEGAKAIDAAISKHTATEGAAPQEDRNFLLDYLGRKEKAARGEGTAPTPEETRKAIFIWQALNKPQVLPDGRMIRSEFGPEFNPGAPVAPQTNSAPPAAPTGLVPPAPAGGGLLASPPQAAPQGGMLAPPAEQRFAPLPNQPAAPATPPSGKGGDRAQILNDELASEEQRLKTLAKNPESLLPRRNGESVDAWSKRLSAEMERTVDNVVALRKEVGIPSTGRSVTVDPTFQKPKEAPAHYRYKADGTLEPIPGGEKDPNAQPTKTLPSTSLAKLQDNNANLRKAEEALALIQGKMVNGRTGSKEATGGKGILGDFILQRLDPEGVDTRAAIADLGSMVIHDRSGAAVTAKEFPRLSPFIPSATDSPAAAEKKLTRFVQEYKNIVEETVDFYKANGYKVDDSALKKSRSNVTDPAQSGVRKYNPATGKIE